MKRKNSLYFIELISLLLMFFAVSLVDVFAAEPGTMRSNAIPITFGESYSKSWDKNSYDLFHYNKIVVPQKGVLNLEFSKPFDRDGEFGRLQFILYDDSGNEVWGNSCYETDITPLDSYILNVGVDSGTYYLVVKPLFYITSGYIRTDYKITFSPDDYCEIEPNNTVGDGTVISLGPLYTGFYGSAASDFEKYDYWKVYLTKGSTYKISFDGYDKISATSTIVYFYDPNGQREASEFYTIGQRSDEFGMNYTFFTAKTTGYYSIRLYNYNGRQFKYGIKVLKQDKYSQEIVGVPSSITKKENDDRFKLNALAETDLSYQSSDPNVARVLSDGTVYIRKPGTTTITITAKENDIYQQAIFITELEVLSDTSSNISKRTQSIRGVPTTITVYEENEHFFLKPVAETAISYRSSNTYVANVYSNGEVEIYKPGSTTITITAEESDQYKKATFRVRLKVLKKQSTVTTRAKLTQTIVVKNKTITLKAKKVKKKAQSIKAAKATKGNWSNTNLVYRLLKVNKSKKSFSVSKSGKIKVKKKTKKGKYKLTILATAPETARYKKAEKKFIVTVKIK